MWYTRGRGLINPVKSGEKRIASYENTYLRVTEARSREVAGLSKYEYDKSNTKPIQSRLLCTASHVICIRFCYLRPFPDITRAKSSLLGEETKGEHIRVICGYFNTRGTAKYRELRVRKYFSNAICKNFFFGSTAET